MNAIPDANDYIEVGAMAPEPEADCDYCTRAAQTGRRLKDYIIRKETA